MISQKLNKTRCKFADAECCLSYLESAHSSFNFDVHQIGDVDADSLRIGHSRENLFEDKIDSILRRTESGRLWRHGKLGKSKS